MGKVRAVANGNILDESEVPASLIAAGIYERVVESEQREPKKTAKAENPSEPPEATEPASTKVAPLTTKDVHPLMTGDAPPVMEVGSRPQGKKRP